MKEQVRFLKKEEFIRTKELAEKCFGNEDGFFDEYYAPEGLSEKERIAVKEVDGEIVSMVHLLPMMANPGDGMPELAVTYLLCVATSPAFRHMGYMNAILDFVEETLRKEKEPWTFLVAVDKKIYQPRGYCLDWAFRPEERDLLCADDGLTDCSAKLLCTKTFSAPQSLRLRT